MRIWSAGFRATEQLIWIKIPRVPLHAWRQDVFREIAIKWGHTLECFNCSWEESTHLEFGRVLVATSIRAHIDELHNIKIDDLVYRIRIWEEEVSHIFRWGRGK